MSGIEGLLATSLAHPSATHAASPEVSTDPDLAAHVAPESAATNPAHLRSSGSAAETVPLLSRQGHQQHIAWPHKLPPSPPPPEVASDEDPDSAASKAQELYGYSLEGYYIFDRGFNAQHAFNRANAARREAKRKQRKEQKQHTERQSGC